VYFQSSNCTGTAYYHDSFVKQVVRDHGGSVYYVPAGSGLIPVTFNSSSYWGSCQALNPSQTIYAYQLSPNIEAITGVPNSGYSGPFTIDIE